LFQECLKASMLPSGTPELGSIAISQAERRAFA